MGIIAIVLTICAFLCLLLAFILYWVFFRSPQKGQNDIHNLPRIGQFLTMRNTMLALIDEFAAVPFEPVFTHSYDGLRLAGKYYHIQDNAPLVICFHGYRGTSLRDFCGVSRLLQKSGFNFLLIDQRAHGKSEGHTTTFGAKERLDCLSWINYCIDRFGIKQRIALYGVSMGASTVLLASGKNLPSNIHKIIADCPYSSAKAISYKVCREMKLSPRLLYPFVSLGAFLFGQFKLSDCDVIAAVKKANVPILIIHGEADNFVPCEMSQEIAAANQSLIRRETFSNAGHGLSFLVDSEKYEQLLSDFLDIRKR